MDYSGCFSLLTGFLDRVGAFDSIFWQIWSDLYSNIFWLNRITTVQKFYFIDGLADCYTLWRDWFRGSRIVQPRNISATHKIFQIASQTFKFCKGGEGSELWQTNSRWVATPSLFLRSVSIYGHKVM